MRAGDPRSDRQLLTTYWRENRRLTVLTLLAWAAVSFGSLYFAPVLDRVVLLGFPLGYLLSAQGALVVFVLLIANYARVMNRVDRKYDLHEGDEEGRS